ncbi:MAG: adenylosuccinate lyase [Gammaproteobacteria bacterium]|nr:adenylosuccinate lyase [Gammaproteobacteria bacterium]OUT94355.1 MAG: adenylosuccinate lyase [Gammaproteobacteria bacterium TMED36]|tara:strand:- start:9528 stop:10892 length:1365 start_codon:yes stop_codon:yes gene_type:complete
MSDEQLKAVSPIDGRYSKKVEHLSEIFSESALMRYRVIAEIKWLQYLSDCDQMDQIPSMDSQLKDALKKIHTDFSLSDARKIKEIERKINHDVKAIEYFLKEKIENIEGGKNYTSFIHFACTSEDINNISYALMLKDGVKENIKSLKKLTDVLRELSKTWASDSMLSRTHGQPASPTTMGKELANFLSRLDRQLDQLKSTEYLAKMNGAVGNYNAHIIAYPNVDWESVANGYIDSLGLSFNPYTTQIEPHDWMAELFHAMIRINNICLDLSRDIWMYISIGYFKQDVNESEVGSSTMPHKVNPIDFENAEGNIGIANAIFDHLASKLTISRMQRDLSDSTAQRNIGTGFAQSEIAIQSLLKGLSKIVLSKDKLLEDLGDNWEILAEPLQTILRREHVENAYEDLKTLTRGQKLNKEKLHAFIDSLEVNEEVKNEMKALTPNSYVGIAESLAKKI